MLVGREVELSAVDRLLAGGGALVVAGEPGVGKTALLEAAAERAGRVLRARGVESESEQPFAAVRDLVAPLLRRRDALPEPQAEALAGALALGPPSPGDRFAICAAVHGLLSLAERPQLVLVDDLQWLDGPSRECVLYLARRLPPRAAMLLACRDEPPAADLPVLRLDRLTDAAAGALLAGRAPDLAPHVAAELIAAAAGVPLALVELVAALAEDQRSGRIPLDRPLPAGPRLHRAFAGRVAALSPGARSALLVLAAHGAAELAPAARALTRLRLPAALLEEIEAAGLISLGEGRVELAHPLVGSVAYGDASPAARRRAHRALAAEVGGDQAGWHLAAAATRPSEPVAAALERTAAHASARRAHATAASALERAARLSPRREARIRRLLEAARAAATGGLTERARRMLTELDELAASPAVRLQATHLRGFLETWDGDVLNGGELLHRSAQDLAPVDPGAGAALMAHAAMVSSVAGDCRAALERAQAAAAIDREADGVPAALCWALALRGQGAAARELTTRLTAQAARLDPLSPEAQFLLIALNVRAATEDYEGAREHALSIVAAAREAGALAALPIALSIAADAGHRLGRWADAREDLAEIVDLAGATGQRMPLVHALAVSARLEAGAGREVEARAAVDRAHAVGRASRVGSMFMFATAALGFLELGLGNVTAALPPLERCEQMAEFSGLDDPILVPWAPDLVEALARLGRRDDARRVLGRLRRCAESSGTASAAAMTARCRGVLAAGAGDREFEQALTHHARSPLPFERARTELAYGAKLHRARRRGDARVHLRAALETFERLGAAPWAEQARAELRAAGARRRREPREGLTAAELRVATAVARGATNREAAAELFLSPKTVEYHLGRAYRKLGVRGRTELAVALHAESDGVSAG